jgi:hypothetical protein
MIPRGIDRPDPLPNRDPAAHRVYVVLDLLTHPRDAPVVAAVDRLGRDGAAKTVARPALPGSGDTARRGLGRRLLHRPLVRLSNSGTDTPGPYSAQGPIGAVILIIQ